MAVWKFKSNTKCCLLSLYQPITCAPKLLEVRGWIFIVHFKSQIQIICYRIGLYRLIEVKHGLNGFGDYIFVTLRFNIPGYGNHFQKIVWIIRQFGVFGSHALCSLMDTRTVFSFVCWRKLISPCLQWEHNGLFFYRFWEPGTEIITSMFSKWENGLRAEWAEKRRECSPAVLRIPIHWIRIQHFKRIRIQGFNEQNFRKNSWKFESNFFDKGIAIYLSLAPGIDDLIRSKEVDMPYGEGRLVGGGGGGGKSGTKKAVTQRV